MKVERIKSSRRRRLTETWSPGRRWRAGASTPSPARDGPAAAWTERNSCRRGWVRDSVWFQRSERSRVQLIQHHARLDPDQQVQDPQRLGKRNCSGEEDNNINIRSTQLYQTCDPGAQTRHTGHFYDIEINKWAFRWCMVWMIWIWNLRVQKHLNIEKIKF